MDTRLSYPRLPLEVSQIFKDWLERHYPDRHRHVLTLLRSMREGKDYDAEWGKFVIGPALFTKLVYEGV